MGFPFASSLSKLQFVKAFEAVG